MNVDTRRRKLIWTWHLQLAWTWPRYDLQEMSIFTWSFLVYIFDMASIKYSLHLILRKASLNVASKASLKMWFIMSWTCIFWLKSFLVYIFNRASYKYELIFDSLLSYVIITKVLKVGYADGIKEVVKLKHNFLLNFCFMQVCVFTATFHIISNIVK